MVWLIFGSTIFGVGIGFFLNQQMIQSLDQISTIALALLLFGIGMDLGRNKKIWAGLKNKGFKVILIPLAIAIGSIGAAGLSGLLIDLPLNEGTAIGAGFGWYSLSGIILDQIYSSDIGAMAFLSNIFRELITIIIMPLLAKRVGYLTTIAPGGATSMDTTLPLISKLTNPETTLYAFISGAILSSLVPILVPLLIKL